MKAVATILALLLAGCSGSPTAPSPTPSPSPSPAPPPTFSGSVTNTVSGAPVLGFSATISAGRLTVSAPGYLTRETSTGRSTVDLIPEAGFDLSFYRQFARGSLDGSMQPLRVLSAAPSIYLQTAGLTAANVAALEQAARAVVPALTGGRFHVQAWETGADRRGERNGWIVVDVVNDNEKCMRSYTGASAGHIWINLTSACLRDGVPYVPLFAHEIGHALGFWHVAETRAIMHEPMTAGVLVASDVERHHAAIAYARQAGNRDVDID